MKVYNTLTRRKEEFIPLEENKLKMYVCGPTVYDYIHIGNARPLVVFDCFHRFMKYMGYDVDYVVNFTDIDDKIINRANEEGVEFNKISEKYIEAFNENARSLNLLEEETQHPRCTAHIDDIINFVQGLIDKGAAYEAEDAVYFDVSNFKGYGELSDKNVEDLRSGARISINDKKDDPVDFAVWKKRKEQSEPAWDSPWGPGRPGWHIECSAMSKSLLGESIDIHAGGSDLEFPHHENERAQSETLTGKTFANYWMHNGMITVSSKDGKQEKMSKSLGNFFRLIDIEKEFDLIIVRMWLISAHYRSPINFSREVMVQSKAGYERLMNAKHEMERYIEHAMENEKSEEEITLLEETEKYRQEFIKVMSDDLNTADALTALYDIAKLSNSKLSEKISKPVLLEIYDIYTRLLDVLGLEDRKDDSFDDERIKQMIEEREEARKSKDYAKADAIRNELKEMGIILKDTSTGVVWERES